MKRLPARTSSEWEGGRHTTTSSPWWKRNREENNDNRSATDSAAKLLRTDDRDQRSAPLSSHSTSEMTSLLMENYYLLCYVLHLLVFGARTRTHSELLFHGYPRLRVLNYAAAQGHQHHDEAIIHRGNKQ